MRRILEVLGKAMTKSVAMMNEVPMMGFEMGS
jgi:hypothetical protein